MSQPEGLGRSQHDAQSAEPVRGPRHVELLVAYANSVDHELNTDELTTPAGLTSWLVDHGLLETRSRSTAVDLSLARQLRDGVHAALMSHHDDELASVATGASTSDRPTPDLPTAAAPSLIDDIAAQLPLRLTVSATGPALQPIRDGVAGALSRVLIAVNDAVADDTWGRLKICSANECRWAYYDATKNRSRRWCEWGCGNRLKTRNYRARQRAARATQ